MNRIKCAYRSFFRWCIDAGHTTHDYSISLRLAKTHSSGTIPICLEEIDVFLNTIHTSEDPKALRDEVLFAVYSFTGIRRSEALPLKVKDYDPVSSILLLNHTKGGNKRRQPVPGRPMETLDRHINVLKGRGGLRDELFLFHGRSPEKPLSKRQVNARFEKWKILSGIRKQLTIHSFRAGFATHLYHSSKDILMVARAMGHKHIKTTNQYIADDLSLMHKAVEAAFGYKSIMC